MAKTRIEKIEDIDLKIAQMENERKALIAEQKEADRKARTNRICERGGYIESVLPETLQFNKEQFRDFINRTLLTNYAKRELEEILTQPAAPSEVKPSNAETPAAQAVEQNRSVANTQEKK
jgi:hypothetical protein